MHLLSRQSLGPAPAHMKNSQEAGLRGPAIFSGALTEP